MGYASQGRAPSVGFSGGRAHTPFGARTLQSRAWTKAPRPPSRRASLSFSSLHGDGLENTWRTIFSFFVASLWAGRMYPLFLVHFSAQYWKHPNPFQQEGRPARVNAIEIVWGLRGWSWLGLSFYGRGWLAASMHIKARYRYDLRLLLL